MTRITFISIMTLALGGNGCQTKTSSSPKPPLMPGEHEAPPTNPSPSSDNELKVRLFKAPAKDYGVFVPFIATRTYTNAVASMTFWRNPCNKKETATTPPFEFFTSHMALPLKNNELTGMGSETWGSGALTCRFEAKLKMLGGQVLLLATLKHGVVDDTPSEEIAMIPIEHQELIAFLKDPAHGFHAYYEQLSDFDRREFDKNCQSYLDITCGEILSTPP